jgi:lambda repressor-like predicted transcriptional regulator
MRLSSAKVKALARERGESVSRLLLRAGVSRTAFYSLARRDNVLPRTVIALSNALGVSEHEILDAVSRSDDADYGRRLGEARRIVADVPGASFENVWHALYLLDLDPAERLNRSLTRGRAAAVNG